MSEPPSLRAQPRAHESFCAWLVGRVVRDAVYQHPAISRVFKRLVAAASRDRQIVREIAGQKLAVEPSQSIVELRMAICRAYEPAMTRYLSSAIQPGMVVVDIGAHIGFFSLLASDRVGSAGKVIAFEPNARNYGRLLTNIALNGRVNIEARSVALADTAGERAFTGAEDTAFSSLARSDTTGTTVVPVSTLDRELSAIHGGHCDLVKIDIEGAELLALRGMKQTLSANPHIRLVIEVHPPLISELGGTANELITRLREHGFSLYKLDDHGAVRPFSTSATVMDRDAAGYVVCVRNGS